MKNRISIMIFFLITWINVIGQAHLPEILTTSPVFIKHAKGTGTGFIVKDSLNIYFVTARHNVFDMNNGTLLVDKIEITTYHDDPSISDKNVINIDIKGAINDKLLFSKVNIDALVIKIAEFEELDNGKGLIHYNRIIQKDKTSYLNPLPITMIKDYSNIYIGDEIYLFGYPTSIGLSQSPQFDFSRPLIRRGVVAGKYEKLGTIVLDCPSYPGNSGGPVIRKVVDGLKWEYSLIGIVVQFIPYEEQWVNFKSGLINTDRYNSGYSVAISGDKILELIKMNK